MSPLPLRRYRAERLLREEFAGRREEVLALVRARLYAQGVRLDVGDLEECYSQAWQGLYAALVAGREVANPVGWPTVVTFRRAIDEHRSRTRGPARAAAPAQERHGESQEAPAPERDLAAELDDRTRLRQLFEGLRGQLSARECEAASLCYLQGLSRSQAAARMGIGETAMRKLMEGRAPGRPGVAGKVGDLLRAIRGGELVRAASVADAWSRFRHPRPRRRALPPRASTSASVRRVAPTCSRCAASPRCCRRSRCPGVLGWALVLELELEPVRALVPVLELEPVRALVPVLELEPVRALVPVLELEPVRARARLPVVAARVLGSASARAQAWGARSSL